MVAKATKSTIPIPVTKTTASELLMMMVVRGSALDGKKQMCPCIDKSRKLSNAHEFKMNHQLLMIILLSVCYNTDV